LSHFRLGHSLDKVIDMAAVVSEDQGPILQNSISAEKLSDKF
jgi:hypothetical protein